IMLIAGVNELWGFDTFGEARVRLRQALLASSFDLVAAFALAVLGWQRIKVAIDRRLEVREVGGVRVEPSPRLRTLLPLTRKFLVTVLIVMTAMLVLSGLGVNIGPLLAGAGVVGLAIGFGAQTLVRDIITGVFFIMDDAFRVGEYIQSGDYKGTVEAIGLRSIKLRHHRGPIFVVPFGELRAVQNLSRDWVIDKLTIGITYDSDLDKAKKLIKKIGQELAQDPELAPHILETLKMQGVEEFGDYAIQVRMKMMTKPGEQFVIRRRAYAMIKKAFDANGIKFASPTVQVSGGADAAAAAAAVIR
ncbi:MAG TPA: mechanosensitive ion channel family protein, partial [Burkholderiales bacterium]|nr:mechanosensitive ion channel family protein [Burkholderiales bacterium]